MQDPLDRPLLAPGFNPFIGRGIGGGGGGGGGGEELRDLTILSSAGAPEGTAE